jgi:transposase
MGNPKGVKRDFQALQRRRLKAAASFEQGLSKAEVARRLGVSNQSAGRWFVTWQKGGSAALRHPGRAGRKPRLTEAQLAALQDDLQQNPQAHGFATNLWTTERVARLIQRRFAVKYHPDHVWRILRQLGWSCQRPTTRARQRDEAAIRRWKKLTWPTLKKTPPAKAAPSSSSTRAA